MTFAKKRWTPPLPLSPIMAYCHKFYSCIPYYPPYTSNLQLQLVVLKEKNMLVLKITLGLKRVLLAPKGV